MNVHEGIHKVEIRMSKYFSIPNKPSSFILIVQVLGKGIRILGLPRV